jgi:squalene-associated FAD-dependent desaturase
LTTQRVAVVGAGWAGLSAAVHAQRLGHAVTLFEMSSQLGGRARAVPVQGHELDNGQHILIGAYRATLELMALVGADASSLLYRMPLSLRFADASGLRLPGGAPMPAFVSGVLRCQGWGWRDKLHLLWTAGRWAAQGFRCDPALTVAQLCATLPKAVREDLVDPLCVAALNTPAGSASASVFLRVLRDALFSGPGSADLLLPRGSLDTLLPQPAAAWLQAHGADIRPGSRVLNLAARGSCWAVDDAEFDRAILACSASEAARLCATVAPPWAAQAALLRYEPIITVYARCDRGRLAAPMVALHAGDAAPAQFVFDLGALGARRGLFAFAISGARAWVDKGLSATAQATLAQAEAAFAKGTWPQPLQLVHVAAERRATFQCTPGLLRPPAQIAPGLLAAGDYVQGPYPATLEGAVLAGRHAAQLLADA